jgi:hypothetical protein
LAVSLYNFDFDDATVKPEHRNWLDTNVVQYHRIVPGLRLYLRGTASRIGSASYNRGLSERRVEAVRDYLVRRGISPGHIDLTWTGADLSTSQANDDEADRAVFVLVAPPPLSRVRFERAAFWNKCDGFDDGNGGFWVPATRTRLTQQLQRTMSGITDGVPAFEDGPSVIVPRGPDPKSVLLVGGAFNTVESTSGDIAEVLNPTKPKAPLVVTKDRMTIQIQPHNPGEALIVARAPASDRVVAKLRVTVWRTSP